MNILPHTFGAARRAASEQALEIQAKRMTGNRPPSDRPAMPRIAPDGTVEDVEQARQVAGQFETLFVQMMVQGLRETGSVTGEGDGMFGNGPGSDQFTQWFDQHMAGNVSRNTDLGVTDAVIADLRRWGKIRDEGGGTAQGLRRSDPSSERLAAVQRLETQLRRSATTAGSNWTGGIDATL